MVYAPPLNNKKILKQVTGLVKKFTSHWMSGDEQWSSLRDGKQMRRALWLSQFILREFPDNSTESTS